MVYILRCVANEATSQKRKRENTVFQLHGQEIDFFLLRIYFAFSLGN